MYVCVYVIFVNCWLCRGDSTIEIWNVRNAPFLERSMTVDWDDTIEDVVWCGFRLFSVGTNSELVEWNLCTLRPMKRVSVMGSACWCMCINGNENMLAIGTEAGYINIFKISDGNFHFEKHFDKQQGRILCCKFNVTDECVVSGSNGCFRVWSVARGHCIRKVNIQSKKDVIVWSLLVLLDFTILIGDSSGKLSVWNGENGHLIEDYDLTKADILTMAIDDEEKHLYCSGVDPTIIHCVRTEIKQKDRNFQRWVHIDGQTKFDHDIRSLIFVDNLLYLGGLDGFLGRMSLSPNCHLTKYPPLLQVHSLSIHVSLILPFSLPPSLSFFANHLKILLGKLHE